MRSSGRSWSRTLGVLAASSFLLAAVPSRFQAPRSLTDQEFFSLVERLSEPPGPFFNDNLVSNERSFAQTVSEVAAGVPKRRAYIGVGPEQNFTFIAATQPSIAFIIDIRRENLLLHLMYKAIFTASQTRSTFLSRLFCRETTSAAPAEATAAALFEALGAARRPEPAQCDAGSRAIVEDLRARGFSLSRDDENTLMSVGRTFASHGPEISYTSTLVSRVPSTLTYRVLMTQRDRDLNELSFLKTEEAFAVVRNLQLRNLVIPVVGNFAGPTAIRRLADYLRGHSDVVGAFYLSNVEEYLDRAAGFSNGSWKTFCENARTLPVDTRSVFVRPLGAAIVNGDGTVTVSTAVDVLGTRGVRHDLRPGEPAPWPSALSTIAGDTATCGPGMMLR